LTGRATSCVLCGASSAIARATRVHRAQVEAKATDRCASAAVGEDEASADAATDRHQQETPRRSRSAAVSDRRVPRGRVTARAMGARRNNGQTKWRACSVSSTTTKTDSSTARSSRLSWARSENDAAPALRMVRRAMRSDRPNVRKVDGAAAKVVDPRAVDEAARALVLRGGIIGKAAGVRLATAT
jgi:hypothetical protein